MAQNKVKHSQRGQNRGERIDMLALSPVARRQTVVRMSIGDFTQATTTKFSRGPLGFAGTLKSAHASFRTAPAGGVLSMKLVAYDASANAEIVLTSTLDPEAGTVREGTAFTLAATNVELAADDTLEIHCVADGSAVSQQQVDGYVTMTFERKEDTTISDV